jgi:hypothetical protein
MDFDFFELKSLPERKDNLSKEDKVVFFHQ